MVDGQKVLLIGGPCDGDRHPVADYMRQGDTFAVPVRVPLRVSDVSAYDPTEPLEWKHGVYRLLTLRVQDGPYEKPEVFKLGISEKLRPTQALAKLIANYRPETPR